MTEVVVWPGPRPKIFAPKNFAGKICLSPFVLIQINVQGEVRLCGCHDWMPMPIGNILVTPLNELLSNVMAQNIRRSIIDGSYVYCNENSCGIIRNNLLNNADSLPDSVAWQVQDYTRVVMPSEIYIAGDTTCNLSCPSCRTHVIKPSAQEKKNQKKLSDIFRKNLFSQPSDEKIKLILSTAGEIFASSFLLDFVKNIPTNNFPNLTLNLQTNGLLARRNWEKLGDCQRRVTQITVSIDASQPETYEQLRRGGEWHVLLDNLRFLQQLQQQQDIKLRTRMVVQKQNYAEIESFYTFSKSFGADRVEYARIQNWGVMHPTQFKDIDVLNPEHELYQATLQHWNKIKDLLDVISWG